MNKIVKGAVIGGVIGVAAIMATECSMAKSGMKMGKKLLKRMGI